MFADAAEVRRPCRSGKLADGLSAYSAVHTVVLSPGAARYGCYTDSLIDWTIEPALGTTTVT